MEEMYWRQFCETGKIKDYLNYAEGKYRTDNSEREERFESDYSDRHGAAGDTCR